MSKKLLITGAGGFLGKAIVGKLQKTQGYNIKTTSHKINDLTILKNAVKVSKGAETIIHGAGLVLSRIEQSKRPGEVFLQNALPAINIAEAAKLCGVKRLIFISSITAYPQTGKPLKEQDLWLAAPQGHASYGYAKRMTDIIALAYRQQYGMQTGSVIFPNLYGPGDKFNFNPPPLVATAILQIFSAMKKKQNFLKGGDNGHHEVDLLHVDDAAESLMQILKKPKLPELINIGTGHAVKIAHVFDLVAKALKFKGKIIWEKPHGARIKPRSLSVGLMKKQLHWHPKITLEQGVHRMVKDYLKSHA